MFDYKFPDIGEGITEGTLAKWLVSEGDRVKEGQDIAEIETDKMTATIPSAVTGTIHKLHVPEFGTLEVGKVFVTIDDGTDTDAKPSKAASQAEQQVVVEEDAGVVGAIVSGQDELPPSAEGFTSSEDPSGKKRVLATPVARKLAKDLNVDIYGIEGTGPGGRIMKEDIRQFAQTKTEHAAAPSSPRTVTHRPEEQREPLTRMRKTIAEKMTQSQQRLVHTTAIDEIDVSELVAFRSRMKTEVPDDVKLTYLPFLLKAIVLALKQFPVFNSVLDEEKDEIVYKFNYHIGIATDTERGLVVPVLFDVDRKSIVELAKDLEALAGLARESKLTLENLRGGTFSITNYGAIGGSFGTPIINYPESAILGIGRIQEKPIVKDGQIVIGHMLPLSLSFDHRIIDGASGVRFMRFIGDALRHPDMLLLRI